MRKETDMQTFQTICFNTFHSLIPRGCITCSSFFRCKNASAFRGDVSWKTPLHGFYAAYPFWLFPFTQHSLSCGENCA